MKSRIRFQESLTVSIKIAMGFVVALFIIIFSSYF